MKLLLIPLLFLSCARAIEAPSDELIITSEHCFVKFTIYRIVDDPEDSLRFQLSDMLDCNYTRELRYNIPKGRYLVKATSGNAEWVVGFEKGKGRLSVSV